MDNSIFKVRSTTLSGDLSLFRLVSMTRMSLSPSLLQNRYYWHAFRYVLILLIALVVTHLLSYNRLPFSAGYEFPRSTFLVVFLFGALICTGNWVVYGLFKLPQRSSYWNRLIDRILVQLASTIVLYSLVYTVVVIWWYQSGFYPAHYLKFLLICSFIMAFEFLVVELVKMKNGIDMDQPSAMINGQAYIPTMTKDVRLPYTSIEMIQSAGGIVTLYSKEFNPLITRHSSLEELESSLPKKLFYRVNRQCLVNRDVIKTIKRNENRTLNLTLSINGNSPTADDIQISRYKRKDFLSWLKADQVNGAEEQA